MGTILAATEILGVVIKLVDQGVGSYESLKKVTDRVKERQAAGKDVTKEDLESVLHDDDEARAALVKAIEEAK